MARPLPKPKPIHPYRYASKDECEDPDNPTQGYHTAEVKGWPPARSRSGEAVSATDAKCVWCGVNVTLYADNDPEVSNWKIKVLERESREPQKSVK